MMNGFLFKLMLNRLYDFGSVVCGLSLLILDVCVSVEYRLQLLSFILIGCRLPSVCQSYTLCDLIV